MSKNIDSGTLSHLRIPTAETESGVTVTGIVLSEFKKYTHYKIQFDTWICNGSVSDWANMAEIYLYDSFGNEFSRKSGSVYTADSEWNESSIVGNAFDSDVLTAWHSVVNKGVYTHWVAVESTARHSLHQIGLVLRYDGYNTQYPMAFTVLGSNDGSTWEQIVSYSGVTTGWDTTGRTERKFVADTISTVASSGAKYLIRSGDSYYSVDGTKLAIAELSAAVFETYGVNTIPTSAVLVTLSNPDVYAWTSDSTAVELIAAVTANN